MVGGNQSPSLFNHIMQNSANGSHTAMWAGAKALAIAKLGELEGLAHLAWLPGVPVKNISTAVYESLSWWRSQALILRSFSGH